MQLIDYLYLQGPAPEPTATSGDVNCDNRVSAADAIYLVNFLFKGGPSPGC